MTDAKIPLLVVAGPTASGKSALGVELAERLSTEIISADSVQVYKRFDIGSGKPDGSLRERIPHHLIDVVEPNEDFNLVRFREEAGALARRLWGEGRMPLIVGGTGLYIKGLIGAYSGAERVSDAAEKKMDQLMAEGGGEALYERAREIDPTRTEKIHAHDLFRLRRVVGVWLTTGVTMSESFAKPHKESPFDPLVVVLDPPRPLLYAWINERVDAMLQAGWEREVERLVGMGYTTAERPMRALGYRLLYERLAHKGAPERERSVALIKQETRRYAKRQVTWLRSVEGALLVSVGEKGMATRLAEDVLSRSEVVSFLARHGCAVR